MEPYKNLQTASNCIIREFDQNVDHHELMWHRDLKDRTIVVLEGEGWFFQLDNELPVELKQNTTIFIPKMQWHRVLRGTSTLKIKIKE
jgi:quercetin dioxygenase-like cupin family protein